MGLILGVMFCIGALLFLGFGFFDCVILNKGHCCDQDC